MKNKYLKAVGISLVAAALWLVTAPPGRAQGSFSLMLTTTNNLGAPLSDLSVQFDTSRAVLVFSNAMQENYALPATGLLMDQGTNYSFNGLVLTEFWINSRIGIVLTNSAALDTASINYLFEQTFSGTPSVSQIIGILQNPQAPPWSTSFILDGGSVERFSSYTLTPVPEPPAGLLAGLAVILGLGWQKIRRHHRF